MEQTATRSKFLTFQKGASPEEPLQYPLTEVPQKPSGLASPMIGSNKRQVPAPYQPGSVEYDEQLYEVLECVDAVKADKWPSTVTTKMGLPETTTPILKAKLNCHTAKGLTEFVHNDAPTDLLYAVLSYLTQNLQVPLAKPPLHQGKPFIEMQTVKSLGAMGTALALTEAFQVKYFFGLIRPEERLGFNCTLYPEGCPNHGSYVSGHATIYGYACRFVETVLNIKSKDVLEMVRNTFRMPTDARRWAGVHYEQDNRAGWDLGQLVGEDFLSNNGFDVPEAAPFWPAC